MPQLKLLIAIPNNTGRQSLPSAFCTSLLNALQTIQNYEIKVFGGLRIDSVRLQMIEYAKKKKCDIIFMIDDDMIIQEDFFKKMISHYRNGKRVVSALYYQKAYPFKPFVSLTGSWVTAFKKDEMYKVLDLGTGAIMIDMKVFSEIPPPAFLLRMDIYGQITVTEDCYFARLCKAYGIQCFVDTTILANHILTISIPDFFSHPYVSYKGCIDFEQFEKYGNISKVKPNKDLQNLDETQIIRRPVSWSNWQDGVDECNHSEFSVVPQIPGKSLQYKCMKCGLIIDSKIDVEEKKTEEVVE